MVKARVSMASVLTRAAAQRDSPETAAKLVSYNFKNKPKHPIGCVNYTVLHIHLSLNFIDDGIGVPERGMREIHSYYTYIFIFH